MSDLTDSELVKAYAEAGEQFDLWAALLASLHAEITRRAVRAEKIAMISSQYAADLDADLRDLLDGEPPE